MDGPKTRGKGLTPAEQRQQRLEQELRANLQKRKTQARARRDDAEAPAAADNTAAEHPAGLQPGRRSD